MTVRNRFCAWLLLLGLSIPLIGASAQANAPATKKKAAKSAATETVLALEPKAVELLKASSARLGAAHTLSFTAVEVFESMSRQGHPLAYATRTEVTLQRPDKLRIIMTGDGPGSEFYSDGKTMTAFAPVENLLATAPAKPTIEATLESAYHSAGIYFPFTDLIVADPYKDMSEGLTLAYYVGQSKVIAGITTDMVACIDNGVFIQMWIGTDDKLPRMLHAVYLDDPEHLRHQLELSDWKLDGAVSAGAFAPSNTAGAKPIPFAHPHPEVAPAAKAPAKNTPKQ